MTFPTISLIIPCYNESARINQMMEGLNEFNTQYLFDWEVFIVDDGSTDNTVSLIQNHPIFNLLNEQKKIKLIFQKNIGKGGALKNGVAQATKEFILTIDADMATHPIEIINWAKLSNKTFNKNVVSIASRTLAKSKLILISNRRNSGKFFNTIVRAITKLPFKDTQCGFKLYPTSIAKNIFSKLQTKGWAHDVEILMQLTKQNIIVQEMPITWNERAASKINVVQDGLKMLLDVWKMKV